MSEKFKQINDYLKKRAEIKKIGIVAHQNADPDAIASAIALKHILTLLLNEREIEIELIASSINKLSENIVKKYNENFVTHPSKDLQTIFLCDSNNLVQLGNHDYSTFMANNVPFFIIDHHSPNSFIEQCEITIIKDEISSTCEIITEIYQHMNLKPTKEVATLLLIGIIFDSRRFIYYSKNTFQNIQYLIDNGADYGLGLDFLHVPLSLSDRMARLKGALRAVIYHKEETIIVLSHIRSHESSVARALIDLGADFGIVLAKIDSKSIRISMRCTTKFAQHYNIHLGVLADKIAQMYSGAGGGHETAAGINLQYPNDFPADIEKMKKYFFSLIKTKCPTLSSFNQ